MQRFAMKSRSECSWVMALVVTLMASAGHAQTVDRSITLQPGWNSVWLDVQPADTDPAAVFAGIPIASVWTPQSRLSEVDFIKDADEPVWNRESWLVYVPPSRIES